MLNLFVEFRFQLFNMKTLFYFDLRVSAGMIENLKTRDITLIPTTFRSTKMFKNVGILFYFILFYFILLTSPDFLAGKPQQRRSITAVP